MDKKVVIGKIVNTRGLRGELVVHTYTENPAKFLSYKNYYLSVSGVLRPVEVLSKKNYKGSRIVMMLKGIADVQAAEDLKEAEILIDARELSPVSEDEFYYHDALGASVYQAGRFLGNVATVMRHGSCDVLEIENQKGKMLYLPVLKQYLSKFDLAGKMIEYNEDYPVDDDGPGEE